MSGRRSAPVGEIGRCGGCNSVVPVIWCEDHRAYLCTECLRRLAEVTVAAKDAPPRAQSAAPSQLVSSEIAFPQSFCLNPCDSETEDAPQQEPQPDQEPEVEHLLRAADRGELSPVEIELPPLPSSATPAMAQVAEFYKRVRGLRLAVCDERDLPFSCRWVARHTGLHERSVHRILEALTAAGVLIRTGNLPLLTEKMSHGTALYAPGVLPSAPVSVERRPEVVGDALQPEMHLRDEPLVLAADDAAVERLSPAVGSRAVVAVHAADATPQVGGARASTDHDPGAWPDG